MEIVFKIGILTIFSTASGILGRMGGAGKPFKTWIRDWLCPLIMLFALWFLIGFNLLYWKEYLLIYGLMGISLTTYYDRLFKFDNLFFSGFVLGLALFPIIFTGVSLWFVLIRAIILALIWGSLNKYLPSKVLIWRQDVAGEFLRYFSVPLTLLLVR